MSAAWTAYRAAAPLLGVASPWCAPFLPLAERELWRERLGWVPAVAPADAWIHAASLGEATAALALRSELLARRRAARIHLSATTRTGRTRLAQADAGATLAPLDTPQAAARFFDAVRPARLFLIETELWPHWLLRAQALGVPVAVVSARLSERSVERLRRFGKPFEELMRGLAGALCQSDADRERWLALGVGPERAVTTGNLKFDALPRPAADRAAARRSLGLDPLRPLLVLASLRPGEAAILARAWDALPEATRSRWQVVAVPRHERALEALRGESAGSSGGSALWRWDERPGVLLDYYAAAEVAFVGGSLLPYGGHNPLEAAASGAAVLMGPHHDSQRPAIELLAACDGVTVVDEGGLAAALARWLGDEEERRGASGRALAAADQARGAAPRTVDRLAEWGLWPRG